MSTANLNSVALANMTQFLPSTDVFNMRLVAREFTVNYNYLEDCCFTKRNVHLILHGGSFIAEQLKTFGACLHLKLTGKDFLPVLKSMKKYKVIKYVGELTVTDSECLLNEDLEIMRLMPNLTYVKFTESSNNDDIKWDIRNKLAKDVKPYWRKLDVLGSLKKLWCVEMEGVLLQDASMLGHVSHVDLSDTFVKDVSALGNVPSLMLHNTPVVDVSALGKVKSLTLSKTQVKDVSALCNAEHLDLSDCSNLEDVSMLTNVKWLSVAFCHNITSAEGLSACETLDLTSTKVKDVSMLGKQKSLCLKNTPVRNVSALKNVTRLNLSYTKVKNVSSLTGVDVLDLEGCYVSNVAQLHKLKKLRVLYLGKQIFLSNPKGVDLTGMPNLKMVFLPNKKSRKIELDARVKLLY
ncbi:MAG TPA: hypothetical protein VLE02_01345 [Nitrosarchaeum sp.]|nr:hypothetical protein [Nitrosarchaeum sp.]